MTAEATDPTTSEPSGEAVSRLAAIVFDRDEAPDEALIAFVGGARARGVRVAGLVQERAADDLRDQHAVRVRDLTSGEVLPIMQDLGPDASGCAVDPAAVAVAARLLERALATNPDLIVVNRFGRLESEGGGMLAEIGRAFAEGVAMIVCVPARYREAWNAFAAGLDAQLPARREAIEAWWLATEPSRGGRL
ncbi:MAG TPA: DUF2478 domain-containing protein [Roseiarcus sp.]|jgi:nucleoside-triphosphatase THEP1|nr:DUF2478 domain-containing protein [Roseiarcus sp.]